MAAGSAHLRPLNLPGSLDFASAESAGEEAGVKRAEGIVEILEAFDLTGSFRAAAEAANSRLLAPHRRPVCPAAGHGPCPDRARRA